ncbi:hypothetical protein K1719_018076 [Acacia pycnantha]|nr:hypothetical protein K1719_018076 [Acacia pycnantha]
MSERRASERRRRTGTGNREGPKEGDDDRDGGGGKAKTGAGFAFGRMADAKKVGEGGSQDPNANLRSGPSSLSYRDKLLSPGCGGFLMKHSEEDDIVNGWKDYFHRMNERDISDVSEEAETTNAQTVRRLEGKTGDLKFTAEEYTAWCLPWMNSLIIKVLGASFPTYIIRDRINRMWRPKDPLKIIPVNNGYYIVSFSNKEDRDYAFQEGPWMIEDHYLIVQRWRPNFNPWTADLQCHIAAWIRLPDVPFEFYNVEYGHRKDSCPTKQNKETESEGNGGAERSSEKPSKETNSKGSGGEEQLTEKQHKENELGGSDGGRMKKEPKVGGGATIVTGDTNSDASPFGKIQILRREFRGTLISADLNHEINGVSMKEGATKGKTDIRGYHQLATGKDKKGELNAIKKELTKEHGPQKSEWVQVGAKRKNANKGKLKGKKVESYSCQAEDVPHNGEIPLFVGGKKADVAVPQVGSSVISPRDEDELLIHQNNMDEQMFDQDKTEGEVTTPKPSTVSQ